MPWNSGLTELQKLLADLYRDIQRARIVVAQAGLSSGRIEFVAAADSNWFNILEEADRRDLVSALVETACDELTQAHDHYHYHRQIPVTSDRDFTAGLPLPSLSTLIPNGVYRIISKISGKCLDVRGESLEDCATIPVP